MTPNIDIIQRTYLFGPFDYTKYPSVLHGYPPDVAIVTNNNVRTTCMTAFIVCHCSGVASCLHVRNDDMYLFSR